MRSLAQSIEETMITARQWLGGDIFPDDVALVGLEVLKDLTPASEAP